MYVNDSLGIVFTKDEWEEVLKMLYWGVGNVIAIRDENQFRQIVQVELADGKAEAIHYLQFHPPVEIGQRVIINQTARVLELGTGGFDFIISPIEPSFNSKKDGHIIKLRYTPYQFAVKSCEEQGSSYHELFTKFSTLDGLPVLVGELHSMLPIIITLFRQLELEHQIKPHRITYIMTDGGALPIVFSNHVYQLKKLGWLTNSITIGNAFGGDLEAVNIFTGLLAAKQIFDADLVIVIMGPGIVGTDTIFGHTGTEQGIIINAVASLNGTPISIIRAGLNDKRERHQGISHHSITNLKFISLVKSVIPFPSYIIEDYPHIYNYLFQELGNKHSLTPVSIMHQDIVEKLNRYPIKISTMGRTIDDDPIFFDFVASSTYYLFSELVQLKLNIEKSDGDSTPPD